MIVRLGLKTIIELSSELVEVVGAAENGEEAVRLTKKLMPDIVLMDIRMPVMDGIVATRIIKERFPGIKVVAMTTFDDDECIKGALQAGADGYLLKDIPADGLIHALITVHKGGSIMSPSVAEKVIRMAGLMEEPVKTVLSPMAPEAASLTPREIEVLHMMADGLSNEEIAKKLYISEGTVRNYVSRIYARLDARDRTQAVLIAMRLGIVNKSK